MACGVPLGELKVGAGALGLCFDGCRQIILCGLRVADAQVFSVARPVVEPKIARELLIAVDACGEAFSDGTVAEGRAEGGVCCGVLLAKIVAGECVISMRPDR